jgi:hypothetical protein
MYSLPWRAPLLSFLAATCLCLLMSQSIMDVYVRTIWRQLFHLDLQVDDVPGRPGAERCVLSEPAACWNQRPVPDNDAVPLLFACGAFGHGVATPRVSMLVVSISGGISSISISISSNSCCCWQQQRGGGSGCSVQRQRWHRDGPEQRADRVGRQGTAWRPPQQRPRDHRRVVRHSLWSSLTRLDSSTVPIASQQLATGAVPEPTRSAKASRPTSRDLPRSEGVSIEMKMWT